MRKKNRTLVIGDWIQDAYNWVKPVGMSEQGPSIVWETVHTSTWAGGAAGIRDQIVALGGEALVLPGRAPGEERTVKWRHIDGNRCVFRWDVVVKRIWWGKELEAIDRTPKGKKMLWHVMVLADYSLGALEREETLRLCRAFAQRHDMVVVGMTQGSSRLADVRRIIPYCDWIVATEKEARMALCDPRGSRESLMRLSRRFVMTVGAEGFLLRDGDTIWQMPAEDAELVDTMGAGDAFLAGFAYALGERRSPLDAALFGNHVAAQKVEVWGNELVKVKKGSLKRSSKWAGNGRRLSQTSSGEPDTPSFTSREEPSPPEELITTELNTPSQTCSPQDSRASQDPSL